MNNRNIDDSKNWKSLFFQFVRISFKKSVHFDSRLILVKLLKNFFFTYCVNEKSNIDILFLFHLDLFSLSLRSENKFQVWTKSAIVPIILETPISFVNRFTNEYFIHMLEFFLWIFFTHYSSSPFKELYLICTSKCSKKHFFFIFLVSFFLE